MSCYSITKLQFSPVVRKRDLYSLDITEKENHIAGGITFRNFISYVSISTACTGLISLYLLPQSSRMKHTIDIEASSINLRPPSQMRCLYSWEEGMICDLTTGYQ